MIRLTIDTNAINARQRVEELNRLERLASEGKVEIRTTHVLLEELEADETQAASTRRAKAARLPRDSPGFMVGHSTVGGPDVIGGRDVDPLVANVLVILGAGRPFESLDANSQRDIRHLATHHAYGRDLFVTSDKGLLRHAQALQSCGIRVRTPKDALAWVLIRLAE